MTGPETEPSTEGLFEGNHWELPPHIALIVPAVTALRERLRNTRWNENEEEMDNMVIVFHEALSNSMLFGSLQLQGGQDKAKLQAAAKKKLDQLARAGTPVPMVSIDIELNDDELKITLQDQGKGFDPDAVPEPTVPENLMELKPSGRGIFLMRQFFDKVTYLDNGRLLELVKRRGS